MELLLSLWYRFEDNCICPVTLVFQFCLGLDLRWVVGQKPYLNRANILLVRGFGESIAEFQI